MAENSRMRFEPGQTIVRRNPHPDGRIDTCGAFKPDPAWEPSSLPWFWDLKQ